MRQNGNIRSRINRKRAIVGAFTAEVNYQEFRRNVDLSRSRPKCHAFSSASASIRDRSLVLFVLHIESMVDFTGHSESHPEVELASWINRENGQFYRQFCIAGFFKDSFDYPSPKS